MAQNNENEQSECKKSVELENSAQKVWTHSRMRKFNFSQWPQLRTPSRRIVLFILLCAYLFSFGEFFFFFFLSDVFPTTFEGSKLMINKMLSSHFQVSHSINLSMSNTTPSGYRFGATYVGSNQVGPMEAYPILLGDIDPSGNLSAHIIHQYKNIRGKYVAQVQDSKFVASQLALDYKGLDYTASLMLANTDILNNSGVAVLHYLQNVIPSLALGAEMVCQYGPQVPGGHVSAMSLAGRYTGSNYTASATVNLASLHACFYRKGGENMQMGVELETNLRLGETLCSIGYQIDLPKANLMFRGKNFLTFFTFLPNSSFSC
ncbi:mitochondrial import receptor subunit TOM40 homolog 1-like [Stegodyphus dumicola]|uniref:mitochondrial import receptor subunit TOM40 homolog 1-like n=1 Tax=Stegodyphus dumicola TaxID=202533 RepID=UPI0015AE148C|nr:mitochondrial import receptor subunit TOM40 homolog 1-like [Stegodyphus dumicola]